MIKYVFFQRRRLRPPTFESPWIHRGWTPAGWCYRNLSFLVPTRLRSKYLWSAWSHHPPLRWGLGRGRGAVSQFLQNNPKIRVRLLCTSLGFLRVYCPHHWLIELGGRPRRQAMLSTNKKWGRGLLYPGGPYRVLLGLNALFSLIFLSLEGNRNWTGKGITF